MNTKLVAFDWDGTLGKMRVKYSWTLINNGLGCAEEVRPYQDMYYNKQIDFMEWCRKCVNTYKEFGLDKAKLDRILKNSITLHKGALETINTLRSKGVKVGIISGGVQNMYDYLSKRSGLTVDYVSFSTRLNFDKRTGQLKGADYNPYDFEGKLHMMKIYCRKARTSLNNSIFVGDAPNDIEVFKKTIGVAFSSDSAELKRHATHIIGQDMRELLKYVEF